SSARAAPMTSAAKPAASRAPFAFPPRSLVAAISGVPGAVQMTAASGTWHGQRQRCPPANGRNREEKPMSYVTVGTKNGAKERSMRIRIVAAAGVAAVVVGAAACSSSSSSTGAAGSGAGLKTATINGVSVVTNAQGFTLYSFAPDTATTSKC